MKKPSASFETRQIANDKINLHRNSPRCSQMQCEPVWSRNNEGWRI